MVTYALTRIDDHTVDLVMERNGAVIRSFVLRGVLEWQATRVDGGAEVSGGLRQHHRQRPGA